MTKKMSALKAGGAIEKPEIEAFLGRLGKKLDSFHYSDYGFVNSICFIKTTDKKEYVLKLIGTMWDEKKTINEVCALEFLKKRTCVPVPAIIDFDYTNKKLGRRYIFMEKIAGEPLKEVWNQLNAKEKRKVLSQIADIFVEMKQFSFDKIGSFQANMRLGPLPDTSLGPFDTVADYIAAQIRFRYAEIKKDRYAAPYIPQFEKFIEKVVMKCVQNKGFVMTHGDMFRNFLIHNGAITGLIDFEWAKASAVEEDMHTIENYIKESKEFLALLAARGLDIRTEWKQRKDLYEVDRIAMTLASHKFWTPFIQRPQDSEGYVKETLAQLDKILARHTL